MFEKTKVFDYSSEYEKQISADIEDSRIQDAKFDYEIVEDNFNEIVDYLNYKDKITYALTRMNLRNQNYK